MGGWGGGSEKPPSLRDIRLADNSLRLYEQLAALVDEALAGPGLAITPALVCRFHGIAMAGDDDAGRIRRADNQVGDVVVLFEPPPWQEVPALLSQACSYATQSLRDGNVLHTAAYALWRLNWIHPFGDGNGRTARAITYAILCVGFGRMLPGTPTVAESITINPYPYWDALQAADRHWKRGKLDVSEMERVLSELVERQIGSQP